ncbi:MAG: TraU family protein [Syntrophaceae bacterium]
MKWIFILLTAMLIIFAPSRPYAVCKTGNVMDMEESLCWDCLFPLSIAGQEVMDGPHDNDTPSMASAPICICPAPYPQYYTEGITMSYWEPARYAETVRDPYCFPSLGTSMNSSSSSSTGTDEIFGIGSTNSSPEGFRANLSTMQAHFFLFPVFEIMDILQDMANCREGGSFGIEFLSEIDPLWNNDLYSFVIDPEGLLFANKASQLSCIADSASSATGYSLDPLFWCVASGGSVYPITGHVPDNDALQAHNAAAARVQFRVLRNFEDCDPGLWYCGCVSTPIWVKHDYRVQLSMPVRDYTCRPYGQTDTMWASGKNPVGYSQENFVWIIFRRHICCDAENKESD